MSKYQDWLVPMELIVKILGPKTMLELGCGVGTNFLLGMFLKVISLETVLDEESSWLEKTEEEILDEERWTGKVYITSDDLDPALKRYVTTNVKKYKPDIVFVDPGIHCRGLLVNHLFDKSPIICAHDTCFGVKDYGWNLVQKPSNYFSIHFNNGQGTTFWFNSEENYKKVVRGLRNFGYGV